MLMDYLVLHKKYNCDLQIGGSDQWGNMVAGTDLIRRKKLVQYSRGNSATNS